MIPGKQHGLCEAVVRCLEVLFSQPSLSGIPGQDHGNLLSDLLC